MNTIINRKKGGYSFVEGLKRAKENLAYYKEDLFIDAAARIIDAMEANGVTRSALARLLKVSPAYITKMLRGHANLSLESLAKVAFAMGLKWECIMIPKNAQIGLFSLAYEFGEPTIRTVKTAVIETTEASSTSSTEDYDLRVKEQHYELRLSTG